MEQQTRRLRYKLHDHPLYQLCHCVADDNMQSLSGIASFSDISLFVNVATAIDEARRYPQEIHTMLLSFGGNLYHDLHRDNPNASEAELRRCTILTGIVLALCLNSQRDMSVTAASQWLSKSLQSYGDVMDAVKRTMQSVGESLLEDVEAWINDYWPSDEWMVNEDGNLVVGEAKQLTTDVDVHGNGTVIVAPNLTKI